MLCYSLSPVLNWVQYLPIECICSCVDSFTTEQCNWIYVQVESYFPPIQFANLIGLVNLAKLPWGHVKQTCFYNVACVPFTFVLILTSYLYIMLPYSKSIFLPHLTDYPSGAFGKRQVSGQFWIRTMVQKVLRRQLRWSWLRSSWGERWGTNGVCDEETFSSTRCSCLQTTGIQTSRTSRLVPFPDSFWSANSTLLFSTPPL